MYRRSVDGSAIAAAKDIEHEVVDNVKAVAKNAEKVVKKSV